MTCGLLTLFGWVVPLLIMMTSGRRSAFVRAHAVESLNFQLSVFVLCNLVANAVGLVFAVVTLGLGWGLVLLVGLGFIIFGGIVMGMASSQASSGGSYRYPLTIRMVH